MRVAVGMSGGIDSSVAALLCKQQGHDVVGVFMQNWRDDEHCTAREDFIDAAHAADAIGCELQSVNFIEEYRQRVFAAFIADLKCGITPNPDVLCNREIKFDAFFNYARSIGADAIATGHYAKTIAGRLYKATDGCKDQSYFLHALLAQQLQQSLFPLADLHKPAVREFGKQHGLHNHQRKDSVGICFIGDRNFRGFIAEHIPLSTGSIIDENGKEIGQHQGLASYTLGQRQGLLIGGRQQGNGQPWYVVDKNQTTNTLMVVQGGNHPLLFRKHAVITNIHWINEVPSLPMHCMAKSRYRQTDQACVVSVDQGSNIVEFSSPQRALTPGQYCVFYSGEQCLGGGQMILTCH